MTAAAAYTDALVLGIDADAVAMAAASRRAAGRVDRGGLPNAVFVASGVERLPPELDGIAAVVTVRLPWGSLLRGALGLDDAVAGAVARLVAPRGRLELTVSVTERDGVPGRAGEFGDFDVARIAAVFGALGLNLVDASRLTDPEARALDSTWARRLRSGSSRAVWSVLLTRP
jgi:hypothetical protein